MTDPEWTAPARSQIDALPPTRAGLLTATLTTQAAARALTDAVGIGADPAAERSRRLCERAAERMSAIVAAPHVRPVTLRPPEVRMDADHLSSLEQLIRETRALATEVLDVQVNPLGATHSRTVREVHRLLSHALEQIREAAA